MFCKKVYISWSTAGCEIISLLDKEIYFGSYQGRRILPPQFNYLRSTWASEQPIGMNFLKNPSETLENYGEKVKFSLKALTSSKSPMMRQDNEPVRISAIRADMLLKRHGRRSSSESAVAPRGAYFFDIIIILSYFPQREQNLCCYKGKIKSSPWQWYSVQCVQHGQQHRLILPMLI